MPLKTDGGMTKPPLVYPHPAGARRPPRADLHQTAGLAYNWALDFMAPGGTKVYAPEAAVVWKLSGHDPALGVRDGDIFGWNIYLHTAAGILYFGTHFGDRLVALGQKVKAGQLIAHVGHWPHDPGRSHTHLGVTHPAGVTAAKNYICKVAQAVMLP